MVGRQSVEMEVTPQRYASDIAPARTFGFEYELDQMRNMGLIRGATLDAYQRDATFAYKEKDFPKPEETLYNSPAMDAEVGWGMSIDMNLCTGCNACSQISSDVPERHVVLSL